jgi:peroxiredoxin
MTTSLTLKIAAILLIAIPATAKAQVQAPVTTPAQAGLSPREVIEAEFQRDLTKLEQARIERLASLAAGQARLDADKTYADLFRSVISAGLYNEAEPIAERVIRSGEAATEVALLAALVNIVAEANRGAYQESLDSLATAIQLREVIQQADPAAKAKAAKALPLASRLALINVYTQRLIHAGQYDVARKALTMIRDSTKEPALKGLAESRLIQLDLVGKPAPAISGTSIDGNAVSLDQYKGNVVLVVFWASWCLPSADEASRIEAISGRLQPQGFRILGINLDTLQDGGAPLATVLPAIRRFLLDHNVRWPNLINTPGEHDYAKAYGVTEIPANVLIGRDGKILHLDLSRSNIEEAITKALAR